MAERQDAARNRAALIIAARELLGSGEELRLSTIAKRAGVGQGTLYRNFASLEEVLGEVYTAEVDALVDLALELVADHEPQVALRRWFAELARYAQVKRGVMAVVAQASWARVSADAHHKLGTALRRLLDAGVAAGALRDDVDARDIVLLSWFLAHVEAEEWDQRVPRLLDVLLVGLSTRPSADSSGEV